MRYLPKDTSHMNFSELPETKADDSFSGPSHTFSGPTLGMNKNENKIMTCLNLQVYYTCTVY